MTKQAKQRILSALMNDLKRRHPDWTEEECARFRYYDRTDTTANGLTACIIDFLRWSGWQAERINTTGLAREKFTIDPHTGRRIKSIGVTWTPTTGNKGSADISATIAGRSVKIEVKVGKDRQSDAQRAYEQAVTSAGGVYIIARDFAGFLEWYDEYRQNL